MRYHLCLPRFRTLISRLRLRPSSVIERSVIREILAEYGLDLTGPIRHPAVVGYGRNLVVETSSGKALLKIYNSPVLLAEIIYEHSILTYLEKEAFPAPRLMNSSDGKTYVCMEETTYALFEFVEGYIRFPLHFLFARDALELMSMLGKTLGLLHNCLDGFEPDGQHHDGFKSLNGDRWRNLAWYESRLARCVEKTSLLNQRKDEALSVLHTLLHRADCIHDRLCRFDGMLSSAALPRLVIHGDFMPVNVLLRKGTLPVVIDFGISRIDWPILDLAKAIHAFTGKRTMGLNFDWMKVFLKAYHAERPISDKELSLIPIVWQFLLLRRIVVCWCQLSDDRSNKKIENEIEHHMNWLEWIISHEDRFLTELMEVSCHGN